MIKDLSFGLIFDVQAFSRLLNIALLATRRFCRYLAKKKISDRLHLVNRRREN